MILLLTKPFYYVIIQTERNKEDLKMYELRRWNKKTQKNELIAKFKYYDEAQARMRHLARWRLNYSDYDIIFIGGPI